MSTNLPIVRDSRIRDRLAAVGQTVFTFDAPLFDAADLKVFVQTPATVGFVERTTGFTTTILSGSIGAEVAFVVPPLAAGGVSPVTVRLIGARTHQRLIDVTRGGTVRSQSLEDELDRQTVVLQELRRDVDEAATNADIADITAALAGVDAARDEAVTAADEATAAAATLGGLLDVPAIEELELPSTIAIISTGDLSVNVATVNAVITGAPLFTG